MMRKLNLILLMLALALPAWAVEFKHVVDINTATSAGQYGQWHAKKVRNGDAAALDRLIFDLKQNNLWSNIVFMQVYGTGYQDASNTITVRGPRPFNSQVGTNYNFGYSIRSQGNNGYVQMGSTVSNVTLVVGLAGTTDTDAGTQTFLLGVQSTDTWASGSGWDSQVSIQKSTGGVLTGQSVGGGAQQFYNPQSGLESVYSINPKTLMFALDTSANTGLWSVNGVANTNTSYSHTDPSAMRNINWGQGIEFGADFICKGTYACRIIYNIALTAAQMTTLDAIIKRTLMPQNKIVFYGDSLFNVALGGSGITEWENIFQSSDFSLSGYPSSVAHSGDDLGHMTNLWPAQLITNIVSVNNIERQIAFLRIGANDIGNYSSVTRPAINISNGIRYFWSMARSNGCEVVGCGLLRRDNNRNTDVQTINTALRTAYANGECDYFIDFDAVWTAAVGEGYWTNTTYFPSDQVHPSSAAGRAVELQAILPLARQIFP